MMSALRRLGSFSAIGLVGFCVDAGVLYLGLALGVGLHWARIPSYLCAVTATWALNRRYTFAGCSSGHPVWEWARFAATQLGGALVNLGTYYALIGGGSFAARYPVFAVAAGSLLGLCVNYAGARRLVFREPSARKFRSEPAPRRSAPPVRAEE